MHTFDSVVFSKLVLHQGYYRLDYSVFIKIIDLSYNIVKMMRFIEPPTQ